MELVNAMRCTFLGCCAEAGCMMRTRYLLVLAFLPNAFNAAWVGSAINIHAFARTHPETFPKEVRRDPASSQIERCMEELRADQAHTDYYSVLRFEIEALRRQSPQYGEYLDAYLQSQLPK